VERHLKSLGRPRQALCAMELRSPRPFTFQGFADFNGGYVDILRSWDILLDRVEPGWRARWSRQRKTQLLKIST